MLPLVAVFVWLYLIYLYQGRHHAGPWLFPDEVKYTQISRSIAGVVQGPRPASPNFLPTLYAVLIAPAWWLGSVQSAYDAAKSIGALAMVSVLFPAYGLSRMLVSRPAAMFVAVASATVPALAYSSLLIEEPLAYTVFAFSLYVCCKAMVTRSRGWGLAAVAVAAVAPFVRAELLVVPVIFAAAVLVGWSTDDRGRRSGRSARFWIAALLACAGTLIAMHLILDRLSLTWREGTNHPGRMFEYGVWAIGALAIGLGVLPLVAALALIFSVFAQVRSEAERAFASLFASSLVAILVYTAVKASYLSTISAPEIAERNVIYLSPPIFVAAALALERARFRLLGLTAATVTVAYLITATPYKLQYILYSEALGLSIIQRASHDLGLSHTAVKGILLTAVVASSLVIVAARLLRQRPTLRRNILAVTGVTVLAWTVAGELAASSASNRTSRESVWGLPAQPDWIDRATHGEPVLYLGQHISNQSRVYQAEFWNRSLRVAWSLDGSGSEIAQWVTPTIATREGKLEPNLPIRYVLADPGVHVVGNVVGRQLGWRLYRIARPLRLVDRVGGVFIDGWMGSRSAYSRFAASGDGPARVEVLVGRSGWIGPLKPTRVTIKSGPLGLSEDGKLRLERIDHVRRLTIRGRERRRIIIPAPPAPFRVETVVEPTLTHASAGASDTRKLGAWITYRFMTTPTDRPMS